MCAGRGGAVHYCGVRDRCVEGADQGGAGEQPCQIPLDLCERVCCVLWREPGERGNRDGRSR